MFLQFVDRARLEIVQLCQVRKMWEDLQRQIRSLHVTVRVERLNNNDQTETQRDAANVAANNPGASSTVASSANSSSTATNSQNESAKNYKKALLENYQRQNSENDQARTYDHSQPSTSRGIIERNREDEPTPSSSGYNVEETSTNISLSNLLPSDSELRQMLSHNLKEMLDGWYSRLTSRCQNCTSSSDANNAQQYATNDHTYSNLATTSRDAQLPSMSSIVSNIGANSSLPTVTALASELRPLPSIFVNSIDRNTGSDRSTQISHTGNDRPAGVDASNNDNNDGNDDANINNSDLVTQYPASHQAGGSTSVPSSSGGRWRSRRYQNLRQRMNLRYSHIS